MYLLFFHLDGNTCATFFLYTNGLKNRLWLIKTDTDNEAMKMAADMPTATQSAR
jgi:hypothetical protein